jgi:endonuclease IV
VIRFGISMRPIDEDTDDVSFVDALAAKGHTAHELAFVTGFPWKEKRCREFGRLAAARNLWLSIHAPYFAVLTVEEEDKASQCLAALEHSMKLGKALGSRIICAHFGNTHGRSGPELMDRVRSRLDRIAPKVEGMGVGLGLEVAGSDRNFGTLGDIALLAEEFSFVRPIVDWAHLHAMTSGALVTKQAFASVIRFVRDSFPGWMISPLQTQFTDNLFNQHGEIRHIPYGAGTLKVGPLVEAAEEEGLSMVIISEAREESSHNGIGLEIEETLTRLKTPAARGRPIGSGLINFPDTVSALKDGKGFRPIGVTNEILLSNLDKPFFPDGYTKGDLIQYYGSVSSVLAEHLEGRPIVMSRYPEGVNASSFYEKRAPGHQPSWMRTAQVHTDSVHGEVEYLLASGRESLMWFANMGCIEIHPWHSRFDRPETPDYAIFDFDPAQGSTWDQVVAGAKLLAVALQRLHLRGYPKLSG